jgi:hypothetical protein
MTAGEAGAEEGHESLATPAEVAKYLKQAEKTLANWRSQGKGPKYRIVGREARYEWPEVIRWFRALPESPASTGGKSAA